MPLKMRHRDPDTGEVDIDALGEAVDEDQFHRVWEPKGWELVDEADEAIVTVSGSASASLDDLKMTELRQLAADAGIRFPAGTKKEDAVELLREHATQLAALAAQNAEGAESAEEEE